MDTKSKKIKTIVSFTAFFLGVSLLLSNVETGIFLLTGRMQKQEILAEDYQDTQEFRNSISDYLETFLSMATGGTPYNNQGYENHNWDWNGEQWMYEDYDDTAYSREQGIVIAEGSSEGDYDSGYSYDSEDDYDNGNTAEQNKEMAKEIHEKIKDDKNLLYSISYDGKKLYTNAQEGTLTPDGKKLPEGYNFLLYFDGETVKIIKDGKALDVYGDGYYEKNSSWYVPGYKNFTVDEKTQKASVYIAVEKSPRIYIKGNYSGGNSASQSNRMYWIEKNIQDARMEWYSRGILVMCAVLLLVLYLCLHKHKKNADRSIARFTGNIWYEGKLVFALILLLGSLFTSGYGQTIQAVFSDISSGYFSGYVLGILGECLVQPSTLLILFWAGYLLVTELRYLKKPWKNSLAERFLRLFQKAGLGKTFQKRMVVRFTPIFFAQLCLAVLAIVLLFIKKPLEFYGFLIALLVIVPVLILLLLAQYAYAKGNREMAKDMGALVEQIKAVHEGNLTQRLLVPTDVDLAKAVSDLNDIQQGLHRAMEERIKSEHMKVELVSNVSHDIKTPLTSIISYVELLKQEEALPDYIREYIEILDSKSQRLKSMVSDVFDVSKAASGELQVNLELLDLKKLMHQTLADMEAQIEAAPVKLKLEIPKEEVIIEADGQRLYRVFQNLLQNALKYSLAGSRVYVTLHTEGTQAMASIKNTSDTEIPSDVDLTERFTRGDVSRTDGGSGLGLSIATSFTEACGGSLHIETIADLFVVTVAFQLKTSE